MSSNKILILDDFVSSTQRLMQARNVENSDKINVKRPKISINFKKIKQRKLIKEITTSAVSSPSMEVTKIKSASQTESPRPVKPYLIIIDRSESEKARDGDFQIVNLDALSDLEEDFDDANYAREAPQIEHQFRRIPRKFSILNHF